MLVGYPPFWDEDQHRLYAQIKAGAYDVCISNNYSNYQYLNCFTTTVLIFVIYYLSFKPQNFFFFFDETHVNVPNIKKKIQILIINKILNYNKYIKMIFKESLIKINFY